VSEYTKDNIKYLKQLLRRRKCVYTVLKHVSRSGMYRRIAVLVPYNNEIRNISWQVADVLGLRDTDGSVGIGGCGMDMGFSIVYNLSRLLYTDSKLRAGDFGGSEPGYILQHKWL